MNQRRRSVLVGEHNPINSHPKFALYPYPRGCTGHRLAVMMGYEDRRGYAEYLETFERVNFWKDEKRGAAVGRVRAGKLVAALQGRRVVLIGYRTARLIGIEGPHCEWLHQLGMTVGYVPHLSGRNRVLNDPAVIERVRAFLVEFRSFAEGRSSRAPGIESDHRQTGG